MLKTGTGKRGGSFQESAAVSKDRGTCKDPLVSEGWGVANRSGYGCPSSIQKEVRAAAFIAVPFAARTASTYPETLPEGRVLLPEKLTNSAVDPGRAPQRAGVLFPRRSATYPEPGISAMESIGRSAPPISLCDWLRVFRSVLPGSPSLFRGPCIPGP